MMRIKYVWEVIKRKDIPHDRRLIGCRWVLKIKRDGVYRSRLCGLGYSQIPGIDFKDHYATVTNDTTFRIMLTIMLKKKLEFRIIDVETAFLYGELKEDIYMKCPDGLIIEKDECVKLKKTLYGLVQSARQWWTRLVSDLKNKGFKLCMTDPCLMFDIEDENFIMMTIYVDDCLVIGSKESLNKVTEIMKDLYSIKCIDNLDDYLGCKVIIDRENERGIISQPNSIFEIRKKFGEEVNDLRTFNTPSPPYYRTVRPVGDAMQLDSNTQTRYRSGIGMLLYMVKFSRPDLANDVRELSKVADGATSGQYSELMRVIKYTLDTESFVLNLNPTQEKAWVMYGLCDSDFAGDQDTRISVGGYILYLNGVPISWRSKSQKGVTMSSTEAEYVAVSELVKSIKFVIQLLGELVIIVKIPIKIYMDNIGAIHLVNNRKTGNRTKHIDIAHHFIREHIEDGVVEVEFVRSEENDSDVFTKNTSGEIFNKHVAKFMINNPYHVSTD
jgi:hypothetical protein